MQMVEKHHRFNAPLKRPTSRRSPNQHSVLRRYEAEQLDALFEKLAAVPWLPKTAIPDERQRLSSSGY